VLEFPGLFPEELQIDECWCNEGTNGVRGLRKLQPAFPSKHPPYRSRLGRPCSIKNKVSLRSFVDAYDLDRIASIIVMPRWRSTMGCRHCLQDEIAS
jgi:hypothetical protein